MNPLRHPFVLAVLLGCWWSPHLVEARRRIVPKRSRLQSARNALEDDDNVFDPEMFRLSEHEDLLDAQPEHRRRMVEKTSAQVIIAGAGFGGVSAADELQLHNITDFVILEASDLIGGRTRCIKFGRNKKNKYPMEVGANWISGSKGNPIWSLKQEAKLQGFNQWFTTALYNEAGEVVLGDWEDQWDTEFRGVPRDNPGAEVDYTYWRSFELVQACLRIPDNATLDATQQEYCNQLCIPLTTGSTFDTLEITSNNLCEGGTFVPGPDVDLSLTDIQRAATNLYPPDADDVCVARMAEWYYYDIELGEAPWLTSSKNGLSSDTWVEFEPADWFLLDKRCYSFLAKLQASKFLSTSTLTDKKIVFDDERLQLLTKVTVVYWDPEGLTDVVVTVCPTERVEEPDTVTLFPCVGDEYNITGSEFISTFSGGVLRASLREETNGVPIEDSKNIAPRFVPGLSTLPGVVEALNANDMGHYTKVYFQFPFEFWPEKEFIVTPWSEGNWTCDFAPMWESLDLKRYYPGSKILFLYTAGTRAIDLAQKTDEEAIEELLPVLNKYFKDEIRRGLRKRNKNRRQLRRVDVKAFHMTRWSEDPLFRGVWSTDRMNSTIEQHYNFARRFGNLIFSGENSCYRHSGYVHGAKFAGQRSVRQLLRDRYNMPDINVDTLCDKTPEELGL